MSLDPVGALVQGISVPKVLVRLPGVQNFPVLEGGYVTIDVWEDVVEEPRYSQLGCPG
jgi:hypothetical protein